MKSTRRSFIKSTILLGAGVAFSADLLAKSRFSPKIGVCTGLNQADMLAGMDFEYIEEGVRNFLIPDQPESEFLKKLEAAKHIKIPVKACNSFIPNDLKSVGPHVDHDRIIEFATIAFERAQKAGIEVIVFGSGGSRRIPDGFSREEAMRQFVSLCKRMAPIAAKHKVVVALEPLNSKECNFITTLEKGAEIVRAVNHKGFRLLADLYHMKMDDEGPEQIGKVGDILVHVHIAEKEGRSAPGTHGEDFSEYFRQLAKAKYKGRISIESRWADMAEQAPVALSTIKAQLK
jgi:sugar phosphate isomerase/epimerase